jgi:hypothetical protein
MPIEFLLNFCYTADEVKWTWGTHRQNMAMVVRWKIYGR